MGRIIINNRTDISDADVLAIVLRSVKQGRLSNDGKQYCYLSSLEIEKEEYHLVSDLRKKSDSFTFYKVPTTRKKHKFKSGETVTLIATREQLKSIGIIFDLKPKKKYKVEPHRFGGFRDFTMYEPTYKIKISGNILSYSIPETFLK